MGNQKLPLAKDRFHPWAAPCTNGYLLAASAITHGLLLTHGLVQLQKQPMGDQFQCTVNEENDALTVNRRTAIVKLLARIQDAQEFAWTWVWTARSALFRSAVEWIQISLLSKSADTYKLAIFTKK